MRFMVRTSSEQGFGGVTIPAQDLEPGGEIVNYQPVIKAAGSSNIFTMLLALPVNVINGQEHQQGFSATGAFSAIMLNNFSLLCLPDVSAIQGSFSWVLPVKCFSLISTDLTVRGSRCGRFAAALAQTRFFAQLAPFCRLSFVVLVVLFTVFEVGQSFVFAGFTFHKLFSLWLIISQGINAHKGRERGFSGS